MMAKRNPGTTDLSRKVKKYQPFGLAARTARGLSTGISQKRQISADLIHSSVRGTIERPPGRRRKNLRPEVPMRQCVGDLGRIEPGVSKIHDSRSYIQTKITEKEEQGCAV